MEDNQVMFDVAKETTEILKYFNYNFVSKISSDFLKQLKELAKYSDKTVIIDKNKSLKDQKILSQTKDLISILYYKYIATDKEKKELINIWKNNDILYQERISEYYASDNIFKNKKIQNEEISNKELPMVIQKKSVIEKIKDFFKNIFHQKNRNQK